MMRVLHALFEEQRDYQVSFISLLTFNTGNSFFVRPKCAMLQENRGWAHLAVSQPPRQAFTTERA